MKNLCLIFALSLFVLPEMIIAQSAGVTVQVKESVVQVRPETKPKKGPKVETAKATLDITLTNISTAELKDLKVKYYVFANSVGATALETLKEGELPATVPPNGTVKLSSDTVSATYTGASFSKSGRVSASGQRLAGYGARVVDGSGKVLGEFFSSDSAKKAVK